MRLFAIILAMVPALLTSGPIPALAWDARTHRAITRITIEKLPPSRLKDFFVANDSNLQRLSVEPDRLRDRYGDEAEKPRHYINVEYFGSDPWTAIVPDHRAMLARFGARTMYLAGSLPWTIDEFSTALRSAWTRGDCREVLRRAGFLSHYVGDASQPLHTTIHYDGEGSDVGVHHRIENAVDYHIKEFEGPALAEVRFKDIDAVWPIAMAEIRESNALIGQVKQADRTARAASHGKISQYDAVFLDRERATVTSQLARAASVLGSIWIFEWKQAGSPRCMPEHPSASLPVLQ
ncbi:MAG: hypothetical protein JWM69_1399 [Candidatus Binatus sp.]|nr:hypothetical protein [Candidatus Binatus sp.]